MQWIFGLLLLVGAACSDDSFFKGLPNLKDLTKLPNLDDAADVEAALKDKCKTNGGENAFKTLKSSLAEFQSYIVANFELSTIKEELETARKTGSMDEVFKIYCDKKPQYMIYATKVRNAVETCLTDVEKPILTLTANITETIINFICEKDGDRLGMFIAEGGFDCLKAQKEGLQKCAEDTVGSKIPSKVDTLPTLAITKEQCDDYQTVHKCAVKTLEGCENKTPANIIDAFLKTIYRLTPCKTIK